MRKITLGSRSFEVEPTYDWKKGFKTITLTAKNGLAGDSQLFAIGKCIPELNAGKGAKKPHATLLKAKLTKAEASNILTALFAERDAITPEQIARQEARLDAMKAKAKLQGVRF